MQPLLIYGSGGLGREVAELAKTVGEFGIVGFIDDDANIKGKFFDGAEVVGGGEFLDSVSCPTAIVFGIAEPNIKARLYRKLKLNPLLSFPKIAHPSAVVAASAQIAEGCVIFNSCFVSVQTVMGVCSLLSAGAQLAHDSRLGDFCSVMPSANICGNVEVGEGAYIGVQSAIRQGLRVGRGSIVGMGSVVVKDVPENSTVAGNPARVMAP